MEKTQILWPGWETTRLIGRGSFGAVHEIQRKLFEDDDEVEKAALKVISIPQNDSDIEEMYNDGYDEESVTSTFHAHLKSIVAEYSLMRKMNGSSNVVNCDDVRYVQHDDGIGWDIYIKMELLTPLAKALPATVSEEQVITIAKDMCAALELCQKHNIIHRDIKPQNIFVSENGDYKLGDFGIAKTVEKTMGGTKTGTYKYMAPEVYGNRPYNHTADIYSLGLVLYWLLNERRMPFMPLPPEKLKAGMDEESRNRRFSGEKIPDPKNGSKELKKIVLKACAFDPKDRYQSAREMREDLMRLSGGQAVEFITEPRSVTIPGIQDDMDDSKTMGPVFTRKVTPGTDESDKTVGPQFAVKEQEKTEDKKNSVKKGRVGIIVAAVLVLVGLCWVFFSQWNPKTQYTLMADSYENTTFKDLHLEPAFGSNYQRQQIRSITFLTSIKKAPKDSWDVSQEQNGTVLAWVLPNADMYDLYIGARGGVLAPQDCTYLFGGFNNLEELNFGGAFDTSNTTNMERMFVKCERLTKLDVSGFDTSQVRNMSMMFFACQKLTKLDLSAFNTSNVLDMGYMFSYCSKLEELEIAKFDTSKVMYMVQMFYECNNLRKLDVSNFKTSNVENMRYMFYNCNRLTELDVSGFDVSNVKDYEKFMNPDCTINGQPWEKFFSKATSSAAEAEDTKLINMEDLEVAAFWYCYGDTHINSVRKAMNEIFTANGVKFSEYDANNSQNSQVDQIRSAVQNGADALVVNIVDIYSVEATQTIIDIAKNANLPLVFFNRHVSEELLVEYDQSVFIGNDYTQTGHVQGKMIGEFLVENYDTVDLNGDGVISYVMFKGQEGNSEAEARTRFSVEDADAMLAAVGRPALKFYDTSNPSGYLVDQRGGWSSEAARTYMQTILSNYHENNGNMVEMVIANNDDMALGAVAALQAVGYNKGNGGKSIPVFGVDGVANALESITAETMTGTVKPDANGSAEAVYIVTCNMLAGKRKLESIDIESIVSDWYVNAPYCIIK